MTTIIICLSAIICVGFVCASFIHVHTKGLESEDFEELAARITHLKDHHIDNIYNKLKEIEVLAEDAKKQLTAHNVAQGFKIGK